MRLFLPCLLAIALTLPAAEGPAAPPPESAVAAQQQAVRDLYKADFAAKDPAKRLELVRRLLDLANAGTPAERIALLREAALAAAKAGDLELARGALATLESGWKLDLAAERLPVYQALVVGSAEVAQAATTDLLAAAADAVDHDQYAIAQKFADAAGAMAKRAKDDALVKRAKVAADEAKELGAEFAKLASGGDMLGETTPTQQTALGRFYGLSKGDWAKALPLLAAGDDATLKPVAAADLAATDAAAREAAGEQWALLARKAQARQRAALNRRALDCLILAAEASSGLARAKLDKRIAELEPLAGRVRGPAAPPGALLWIDGEPGPDGKSIVDAGPGRLNLEAGGKVLLLREGHGGFLRFDGSGGLTTALKQSLPPSTAYSIAFWLRGSAAQDSASCLVLGGDDMLWHGKGWVAGMYGLAGEVKWFPQLKVGATPGGVWHHLVFVLDPVAKVGLWYTNGALAHSSPKPPAALSGPVDKVRVGTGRYAGFAGDLDQVGFWSRALTADEAKALYEAGKNGR
jgi:hypothetical protein